jgi:adenine-specific DNA-methyltransferase
MKLYEILENQLKRESNFVSDEGELKKWVVLNKAQNFDEELLELLLEEPLLKEKFFKTVAGVLCFNQSLFVNFLEQKNFLNDSYTQFKNKVGLTIDGKYLKQRNEVALVWPFKDCILEGGQSREEDKREEIFFNEILAQDEITQLLEPKVLTNAKRIDQQGKHPLDTFTRDAEINRKRGLPEDTITDNLIIKGNNLLALHTLKEEFSGKVKLIYIDPPFNTERDSFRYNDSFTMSTWLTFIKNRLQVAKGLLKDDGNLIFHIDNNQSHHSKLLLDEVFGPGNFINEIVWHKGREGGSSRSHSPSASMPTEYQNIFIYSKNRTRRFWQPILGPYKESTVSNIEKDDKGWYYSRGRMGRQPAEWEIELGAGLKTYVSDRLDLSKEEVIKLITSKDAEFVSKGDVWGNDFIPNSKSTKYDTEKPEKLLMHFIQAGSSDGDIVLDFFLGSGTTTATALKLKRQFIGVEQLEGAFEFNVKRLTEVVNGCSKQISKLVNWKGGGSFVFLELKKYNQTFIELIEAAKDTAELLQIWEQMKAKSFLNYNVDIKKQDAHLEEFKALSLAQQKQHLCELLDKNQLYVNRSSLHDADFACTAEEKKVTADFFQLTKK